MALSRSIRCVSEDYSQLPSPTALHQAEPELGSAGIDLYACPLFDDRVNIHTGSQGAPIITHVLCVCPPVKFLGGLFGEMNGAKVLKDISEFSKQNLR